MTEIVENGPWEAYQEDSPAGYEIGVESNDFTHDARLIVYGDFEDLDQKFAYAQEIAKRLNSVNLSDGPLRIEIKKLRHQLKMCKCLNSHS